jgi:indolepyruvate ferredoxin oxidoreductase alpha subunit
MAAKRKKIGEIVMMGNEAMARGLLESGVQCATSYPGTPASEILEAVIRFKKQEKVPLFAEWAINEKVALNRPCPELPGPPGGRLHKQVGLNVASDPLMSAAIP